jgi:hypothetical protein
LARFLVTSGGTIALFLNGSDNEAKKMKGD